MNPGALQVSHTHSPPQRQIGFAKVAEGDGKDWKQVANMLNNFAWWCFENKFNLEEAEEHARAGVEIAKAGNQKANILDTVAEICNLRGDCGDAVTLIRMAVAEDPENEYFQKHLDDIDYSDIKVGRVFRLSTGNNYGIITQEGEIVDYLK